MSTTNSTQTQFPITLNQYLLINNTDGTVVVIDNNGTSLPIPPNSSVSTTAETPSILAYQQAGVLSVINLGSVNTNIPISQVPPNTAITGGYVAGTSTGGGGGGSLATYTTPGIVKVGSGLSVDGTGNLTVNTFSGATSTVNGQSGSTPAPVAGQQNNFLRGDGSWVPIVTSTTIPAWALANAYTTGSPVQYIDGNAYIANGNIPANTAFTLGTTGATWSLLTNAVISNWTLSGTYAANQLVLYTDGNLYTANAHIPANTAFVVGTTGTTWKQQTGVTTPIVEYYQGYINQGASPLTQFANAQENQFWVANTAGTTGGVTFNIGDTLFCVSSVTGTPANLTGPNWSVLPHMYPVATNSTTGIVKIGNGLSVDGTGNVTANTLVGATAGTAGSAGIAPAPLAGQQNTFLRGDGTWAVATGNTTIPAWVLANSYLAGTPVQYIDGNAYVANGAISANTPFTVGTTGATWSLLTNAVVSTWVLSNSYAQGQAVLYTDGNLYLANSAIPANTAFTTGTTGATWKQITGLPGPVTLYFQGYINQGASPLTQFANAVENQFWVANSAGTTGGVTFNIGDTLYCVSNVTGTPANLTGANWTVIPKMYRVATASTTGIVKIGNGLSVDGTGNVTPNIGTGLLLNGSNQIVPDPANIDVTTLKNFSVINTGVYSGAVPATLAGLANATKGQFWVANPAVTLNGTFFALGDQLFCTANVTGTPANLNNFAHVVFTGTLMTGATSSIAGTSGLVTAPTAGQQGLFLRGDATWAAPVPPTLTGSSAGSAGTAGLVPAPIAGQQTYLLQGDATWVSPTALTANLSTFNGASVGSAGTAGTVPAPSAGQQGLFLRGDATWQAVASSIMTGATAGANGTSGSVPAPVAGQQGLFLRGDATWQAVTASGMTGASAGSAGTAGSVPAPAAGQQNYLLQGNATWISPSSITSSLNVFGAASAGSAGSVGIVPQPTAGQQGYLLSGNSTWVSPASLTSSLNTMVGATGGSAGVSGTVPAPASGQQGYLLSGAATWVTPASLTSSLSTFGAASAGAAGSVGVVPAPALGQQNSLLAGNATWITPSSITSSLNTFTGASAGSAGVVGIVPAPAAGQQGLFLRGDATWQNVTTSTMTGASAGSAGTSGSVPAPSAGQQNNLLAGNATWVTPASLTSSLSTFGGASAGAAGSVGIVPAPTAGQQNYVLSGAGTWVAQSTTSTMTGATAGAAGTSGSVPAPSAGQQNNLLAGNATWVTPASLTSSLTTFGAASAGAAGSVGIVPQPTAGQQNNLLAGNATWVTPASLTSSLSTLGGATAGVSGTAGIVPQPVAGQQSYILLGNGNWTAQTGLTPFSGATAGANGSVGVVPQPTTGQQNYLLQGNSTWVAPSSITSSLSSFGGATSGAAGSVGIVPAPSAGQQRLSLLGSGSFGSAQGNAPAWVLANAYSAYDLVTYTDGNVYYANAAIPANTAWATGSSGATWHSVATLSVPNVYCRFTTYGSVSSSLATSNTFMCSSAAFTLTGASSTTYYTSGTGSITIVQAGDYEAAITIQVQNTTPSTNQFQLAINGSPTGTVFVDRGAGTDSSSYHNVSFVTAFTTSSANQTFALLGKTSVSANTNGFECVIKKVA